MPLRRASTAALFGIATLATATSRAAPPEKQKPQLVLHSAPAASVKARLMLDKAFYEFGDTVRARVVFEGADPSDTQLAVMVVSRSGDVELIGLKKTAPGVYETELSRASLVRTGGAPKPHDGKLEAKDGEPLSALLMLTGKPKIEAGADMIGDMAIVGTNAASLPKITVAPKAMSAREMASSKGPRPFGLMLARGGLPVEIALNEVLFTPHGAHTLKALLQHTGGKLKGELLSAPSQYAPTGTPMFLVELPPSRGRADRLADLRAAFSEKAELVAGQQATVALYAAVLELRMRGFAVSANPRLAMHGSIGTTELSTVPVAGGGSIIGPALAPGMKMTNANGNPCTATNPLACPLNVPALWAHMALWDRDTKTIPVAFIDEGFATANRDFRHPAGGGANVECDFESLPVRCGPGVANTTPTVGASLVGARVWHGTGSVSVAGGVLNNGWLPGSGGNVAFAGEDGAPTTQIISAPGGVAGTGGQVLVPMMYRFGTASYAFDIGAGIRRAVDDGAAVINIAAGYPCNVHLGPLGDFELCDPGARARACGVVVATLGAAASAVCAASAAAGLIPVFGQIALPGLIAACGAATTVAVASIPACAALVAIGDTRSPMEAGVRYATEHGVPIVASVGNRMSADSLPEALRPFLDMSSIDGDGWKMVPATLPGVIAVGAASIQTAGGTWMNNEFRGASVAVWAPEQSNYISPRVGGGVPTSAADFPLLAPHGGTSAASSYVTGIVAAMQAASASLDPHAPGILDRRGIPARIRAILVHTATEMGPSSAEPSRLTMVNPFKAVLEAWGGAIPRFDANLNFDDDGTDDRVEGARVVAANTTMRGTLITIPSGGDGAPAVIDRDFFKVQVGHVGDPWNSVPQVTLTFPASFRSSAGDLVVADPGGRVYTEGRRSRALDGTTTVEFSGPVAAPGATVTFQVMGTTQSADNVYELTAAGFAALGPDRFDRNDVLNFAASTPNNDVPGRAVPIGVGLAGAMGLAWSGPTHAGYGADVYAVTVPNLNFHVDRDEDWFVVRSLPTAAGTCGDGELTIALPPEVSVSAADPGGGNVRPLAPMPGITPRAAVVRTSTAPFLLRFTAVAGRGGGTYTLDLKYSPPPMCRR